MWQPCSCMYVRGEWYRNNWWSMSCLGMCSSLHQRQCSLGKMLYLNSAAGRWWHAFSAMWETTPWPFPARFWTLSGGYVSKHWAGNVTHDIACLGVLLLIAFYKNVFKCIFHVQACAHRYVKNNAALGVCYTFIQTLDYENIFIPCNRLPNRHYLQDFGLCQAGMSAAIGQVMFTSYTFS